MKKILMGGLVMLCAACAATNMTPDKVHVQNGTFVSDISATDKLRESDGVMTVSITGQVYEDAALYWRVVWFDADGIVLKSALSKPTLARVRRGQPFHWTTVAPSNRATSYQVYVSDRPIEQ